VVIKATEVIEEEGVASIDLTTREETTTTETTTTREVMLVRRGAITTKEVDLRREGTKTAADLNLTSTRLNPIPMATRGTRIGGTPRTTTESSCNIIFNTKIFLQKAARG
jgi:hypothetical protein